MKQAAFIAACLLLPLAWGWLTNALFLRFWRPKDGPGPREPAKQDAFIDYQI